MSIIGHMATFPARRDTLEEVIRHITPSLDRLMLVLNEFEEIPAFLKAFPNVEPLIPSRDLKDLGKFYPAVEPGDVVFLLDDDILYPPEYVTLSLKKADGRKAVFTYHGAVLHPYRGLRSAGGIKRSFQKWRRGYDDAHRFRTRYLFWKEQVEEVAVNLAGTGVSFLSAELMPPFSYMDGASGFIDLRMACWCAEKGIPILSLPKEEDWLSTVASPQSLFEEVTQRKPVPFREELARLMANLD